MGISYDDNFRVKSQHVNGDSVGFQYDNDSLLTTAGARSIARDAQSWRITGTSLGSVTTSQSYNSFGELSGFQALFNVDTLFKTVYAHDSLGRIIEILETIQGETKKLNYAYDATGRLSEMYRNDTQPRSLTTPSVV